MRWLPSSIHLRSTQAQIPRLQYCCGTSARDPGFIYAKSRDLNKAFTERYQVLSVDIESAVQKKIFLQGAVARDPHISGQQNSHRSAGMRPLQPQLEFREQSLFA
ncbi:hypothetical protein [Pseudomonas sp. FP2338]|uniref:hypothetical protein n=1 Tax=Pseudomonas sp. FP2338 TaxID=2954093 RepID=UPI0027358F1F|nr:hypothetical protein [Pseudomonas sp. FP2338]WLH87568.1 hypothetical protein PSH96_14285 [Pseudomonas sp. FP2338]